MELQIQISILKRNANLTTLNNKEKLPKLNHVKPAKQKDVENLMTFFNVPDDAKDFYHDIFQPNELITNENEETNEEGVFYTMKMQFINLIIQLFFLCTNLKE